MKILFVHPAASMSIWDVGRGYRNALEKAGHEIRDYSMIARLDYHSRAIPPDVQQRDPLGEVKSRAASETILNEALCSEVDLVLIISGLNVHPISLWLLGKVGIPAAVILTESPYDDESQKMWCDLTRFNSTVDLTIFTNDLHSSQEFGWNYLPPAYDPEIHRPVEPNKDDECDVVMVGTGWGERQAFLEAVNWDGINLKLHGIWPNLKEDSPLFKFFNPMMVNNERIAEVYCSSKICLNFHRRDPVALTSNPRAYEIAACGAFQLSDVRERGVELFKDTVPTFDSPEKLQQLVRYYLDHDVERVELAKLARNRVANQTFDDRVQNLMVALDKGVLA